jgi:hypothetical protein
MYLNRPSDRELTKKILEARAFLKERNGLFANLNKVVGELYELGVEAPNQVWQLILVLLEEISLKDYAGGRPPQKATERAIENRELFAFCWQSAKLGKLMYIKFALVERRYYYVSLHVSKEKK